MVISRRRKTSDASMLSQVSSEASSEMSDVIFDQPYPAFNKGMTSLLLKKNIIVTLKFVLCAKAGLANNGQ